MEQSITHHRTIFGDFLSPSAEMRVTDCVRVKKTAGERLLDNSVKNVTPRRPAAIQILS